LHSLAIQRDEGSLSELRDGSGPGQEALLKALGIEAGKHPAERIVGRDAMGQGEKGPQPGIFALTEEFHIL